MTARIRVNMSRFFRTRLSRRSDTVVPPLPPSDHRYYNAHPETQHTTTTTTEEQHSPSHRTLSPVPRVRRMLQVISVMFLTKTCQGGGAFQKKAHQQQRDGALGALDVTHPEGQPTCSNARLQHFEPEAHEGGIWKRLSNHRLFPLKNRRNKEIFVSSRSSLLQHTPNAEDDIARGRPIEEKGSFLRRGWAALHSTRRCLRWTQRTGRWALWVHSRPGLIRWTPLWVQRATWMWSVCILLAKIALAVVMLKLAVELLRTLLDAMEQLQRMRMMASD